MSLVFLFLLLLVILLGAFSIGSLRYFNAVSSQVSDRWLPSTRVLGDLNNLTSDHRVAEASLLLAATDSEHAQSERQLDEIDRHILESQRAYAQIPRGPKQNSLYARFASQWDEYSVIARRVRALSASGDGTAARDLYNTTSKVAYETASATFDSLLGRDVASARQASLREDVAYLRARWLVISTIALAGLSVPAAMLYVRRSISAPVLDLAASMHRLATNETSIEIGGTQRHDEIGEMARAVVVFRNNAIELMNSRLALEQQASMLQEKLAEEQRLMLLQRNFVSMASHEFRTPLTIIDAHAQRLIRMKDRITAADLEERARKIRSTVLRITHLIRNLIDSARVIDSDVQLYFHPSITDVGMLLHEVCQLQREIVPQARILEHIDARPLHILGDSNLLFQVFCNLLSNAVKYSPGAGLIEVTAAYDETSHLVISVEDHGIGIAEADRTRLFERYFRGSNVAGITGTGVGLYFVKMVVELHGGEVAVDTQESVGSKFVVRLPLKPVAGHRMQPPTTGHNPCLTAQSTAPRQPS
jgi:signal transduction histidine kinase